MADQSQAVLANTSLAAPPSATSVDRPSTDRLIGSPRFVGLQAAGCSPLVRAFAAGREQYRRAVRPRTVAAVSPWINDGPLSRTPRRSGGYRFRPGRT
jgi:hypothetical protein